MKESSRKVSTKTLSVSRKSNQLPSQSFDRFECFKTAWFSKLIILFFGMAMVVAADLLFTFPSENFNRWANSGMRDLAYPVAVEIIIRVYCMLVGFGVLILVIFVSVCLAIQSRGLIRPLKIDWLKATSGKIGPKKKSIFQTMLWTLLISSFLGGFMLCDWFLRHSPLVSFMAIFRVP